jgi:molybdopterin-binding protein
MAAVVGRCYTVATWLIVVASVGCSMHGDLSIPSRRRPNCVLALTCWSLICHDEGGIEMRLSTQNQLKGRVESLWPGSVMTIVKVILDGGQLITASITKDGVEELDLSEGDPVTVLIKSTEVMLAVE